MEYVTKAVWLGAGRAYLTVCLPRVKSCYQTLPSVNGLETWLEIGSRSYRSIAPSMLWTIFNGNSYVFYSIPRTLFDICANNGYHVHFLSGYEAIARSGHAGRNMLAERSVFCKMVFKLRESTCIGFGFSYTLKPYSSNLLSSLTSLHASLPPLCCSFPLR